MDATARTPGASIRMLALYKMSISFEESPGLDLVPEFYRAGQVLYALRSQLTDRMSVASWYRDDYWFGKVEIFPHSSKLFFAVRETRSRDQNMGQTGLGRSRNYFRSSIAAAKTAQKTAVSLAILRPSRKL